MQSTRSLLFILNSNVSKKLWQSSNFSRFGKFKLEPSQLNLKNQLENRYFQIRNFKNRTYPENFQPFNAPSGRFFILKSALFTTAFAGACYSAAVIINYERVKNKQPNIFPKSHKFSEFRNKLNEFWNSMSDVKKVVAGIVFLNGLVFVGWRLRNFQEIILKYFVLTPSSGKVSQMVLSTFSHQQFFHFVFNMVALYSMSTLLEKILPVEQFLAFYLSSGVFASFSSSLAKVATSSMGAMSLGASGAIVGCFALASLVYPHSKFYIFPIPFEIEAQTLLKFLVMFDLVFLLMGSKKLDHAAHLGGALYGYIFFTYGPAIVNNYQSFVIKKWKEIRSVKN